VEDIPFHLRQIKKYGGPVLELACGTGRITIPMAEKGIEITGLDVSETMLSHARRKTTIKGVNVEWIKADCRNFKLNKKFNLIFFPFNSITHLHDLKSLEACFSCVKEHLTRNGRFVIDVFNPHLDILMRDPSRRYHVAQYSDPDGKGTVIITENNIYDTVTQINRIKWYYSIGKEKDKFVVENNMRILFPQELDVLLLYNGFTIETKFGNYDETPFDSASPKQLVVCYPK
jgi:2-polyprenyl-3-methyl-5-hydroxy-6-metoxy-1,4-benzoquinol methylase